MPRRLDAPRDLDLVPVMNLVTILIPFLLMGAGLAHLATVDATLAGRAVTRGPSDDPAIRIRATAAGWEVSSADTSPVRIERLPDGGWDVAALRSALGAVKDAHPAVDHLTLAPDPTLPYEDVVVAMDAAREDPGAPGDGACAGRCLFGAIVVE